MLGRAPDGRPYFLEERKLIWANSSISFPSPNSLTHALKYLRAVLASTSLAHWQNLKKKITLPEWGDDPIAYRWRSILESDWGTLPDKPSPLVVDNASKQLCIRRDLLRA